MGVIYESAVFEYAGAKTGHALAEILIVVGDRPPILPRSEDFRVVK